MLRPCNSSNRPRTWCPSALCFCQQRHAFHGLQKTNFDQVKNVIRLRLRCFVGHQLYVAAHLCNVKSAGVPVHDTTTLGGQQSATRAGKTLNMWLIWLKLTLFLSKALLIGVGLQNEAVAQPPCPSQLAFSLQSFLSHPTSLHIYMKLSSC